jgi:hypothetical protein
VSKGSMRQRSPGSWELKWDTGVDPETGKRQTRTTTFRGNKADAARELRVRLVAVDKGEHVNPSKLTVNQLVKERINTWVQTNQIRQRTADNYMRVLNCYISPHIGSTMIQKLTAHQIETWHGALFSHGVRRERGVRIRTCQRAHTLLSQCMSDAVKYN